MSLYIDLTELLSNPVRTGIQRVTGEICRYLPPKAATPVRLHGDRLVALPPALIQIVGSYFREASESAAEEIRRLGNTSSAPAVRLNRDDTVLVPEVFYDAQRLAFFRQMSEEELQHYRFIVYDLLPITHPEHFAPDLKFEFIFGYFQIVRRASNCGFISAETRDIYHKRLRRSNSLEGVVLPLGADAVGPRRTKAMLNRALEFSVIGTIEPRKNHRLILEAFEPLLGKVKGLSLTFAGKIGWVDREFAERIGAVTSNVSSGVRFESNCEDGMIRGLIERSRATIYVSAAEGYGLPPVESLWLGTPVIASTMIPSLKRVGETGVYYVEPLSAVNLRRAVLAFMDDDYANRKTEETISLELPTWQLFAEAVLAWCEPGRKTSSGVV
jgi:glycosyltransferase involved in cell wall biosynthesis